MKENGKQKQHFEYVSYEEAQELEKKRQENLEKIRKGVQKIAAELRKQNYEFELEETSDLFIVKKGQREIHMAKAMAADPNEIRKSVEELHSKQGGSSVDASE